MALKLFHRKIIIHCLLFVSLGLIFFMTIKYLVIAANTQEQEFKQQLNRLKNLNTTIASNQLETLSDLSLRQRWGIINKKNQFNEKSETTTLLNQQDAAFRKKITNKNIKIERHQYIESD